MDRQWVKNRNRISPTYVEGIKEFINVAKQNLNSKRVTLCPCVNCLNTRCQSIDVVRVHLISVGINDLYTWWVYYGEREVDEESEGNEDFVIDEVDGLRAGLHDAIGDQFFNVRPIDDLVGNNRSAAEKARYEKLYETVHNPLYEGCQISALTFIVKLMNIKVMNKWSNNSFEMLLKLLHEVLPKSNNCPPSYYDNRKLLCEVGLGYELIDICKYDCAIFYGEARNATACPVCNHSHYVRNKMPYKRLQYFPIMPRLKRLYYSRHTARDMRWYKDFRKEEPGVLCHLADGKAWKHFDDLYPNFATDSRNVQLELTSDNPFSNMTTAHSLWPVILMPYNMPPWRTMHKSNYFLALLIPRPKSPSKYFDVFRHLWMNLKFYGEWGSSI